MDRDHGTERLADASFLEELLRGRRVVVLAFGDPAPAQHLAKRLGGGIATFDGTGAPGRPDGSADAVVALGGFQEPSAADGVIAEARRLLAPGGIFAVSWTDLSRASLEARPSDGVSAPAGLPPSDAARRLRARFPQVVVVARQPYLGFQYVSGIDSQGALTLDSSLAEGGTEAPTGYLALAGNSAIALGDALIQVPYDRAVARVARWVREVPATVPAPSYRQTGVARTREAADDVERMRAEVAALRDRSENAVEEADRARGEVRAARERAALLEAEVAKLRGRVKGVPEAEAEKLRAAIIERTRERDSARRDAEGAAGEAARVLEAAANLEREVEFLQGRVTDLDRETGTLRQEKARIDEDSGARLRDARTEARNAKADADKARDEVARFSIALEAAKEAAAQAASRERTLAAQLAAARTDLSGAKAGAAEAEAGAAEDAKGKASSAAKRAKDFEERYREANAKLSAAVQKASDLELARAAAERSAEDAWKRIRESGGGKAVAEAPPAGDLVPAADLAAAQRTLVEAIARADAAERERRRLQDAGAMEASPGASDEIRELEKSLKSLRDALAAARRRADDADARAVSLDRVAEDAKARLAAAESKAGGADAEGLRSLVHQRETALNEARTQAAGAETRAARFSAEASEAIERLKKSEETLAEREVELKKALGALDGVEQREQRDRELLAELKGEIARLTEAMSAAREELERVQARGDGVAGGVAGGAGGGGSGDGAVARERDEAVQAAGMAQVELARMHAEGDVLREQLQRAEAELSSARSESSKGGEQSVERERRIADLEAKLIELKAAGDTNSEMERRSVAMAEKLAHLEADLERAQFDVKQATAEARKYRALAEAIEPPADRSGGRS